jgi:DNA mismatch repair ATPase MutL
MIADGNYPSFVLFLEIAPDLIDVNVHPQKKEVRFAEEGKIFGLVESAVASAILSPAPVFSEPLSFSPVSFSFAEAPAASKILQETQSSFDLSLAMRPLAMVDGYLFLQQEALLLIDLRRAHARVLYEDLKDKKGSVQNLIWPIEASIEDEETIGDLQGMGIECRLIGKNKIAVDALPSFIDPADFPFFLATWKGAKKLDFTASQIAMQTKRKFALEEALTLWKHLLKCRETRYDPLGRKIWEKIEAGQLKKMLEGS